jgi:hypothetical protein
MLPRQIGAQRPCVCAASHRSDGADPSSARALAQPGFLHLLVFIAGLHMIANRPSMTRAWVEVDLATLRRNGAAVAAAPACHSSDGEGRRVRPGALHVALEELSPGFRCATTTEGRAAPRRIPTIIVHADPAHRDRRRRADLTPALAIRRDRVVGAHRSRLASPDRHGDVAAGCAGIRWRSTRSYWSERDRQVSSRTSTCRSRRRQPRPTGDALQARCCSQRPALVHAEWAGGRRTCAVAMTPAVRDLPVRCRDARGSPRYPSRSRRFAPDRRAPHDPRATR